MLDGFVPVTATFEVSPGAMKWVVVDRERVLIANDFVKRFDYDVPILIDGMENRADSLYAGWPERFYIVDESNTIVYKGKTGPFGYHPEEVEAWLAGHLL